MVDLVDRRADETGFRPGKMSLRQAAQMKTGNAEAERADLVLPGCAIFEAIRRAFPSQRVRIADRGLREGILVELMQAYGAWSRAGHER